ncbi:autotransporter outer membrane beta-barrel domain-containing protein, partial [Escherichia coli]|nr:autotransporter outer membrane beta-barrel domain-containing protein [Escherichia coli]
MDSIDVNKTTTDVSILNRGVITPGNNVLVNNTGGDLNIISSDSILNGATKLVSGTTTLKLSENTIWNMKDDSVVTHLTNSDSIINLSYDDGQTFTQGKTGSDSNLLIVFYVQIMPDDLVMQLHQ